jgi:hypothetical protein
VSKRPHYVPLVRLGEFPNRSPSPRAMLRELVIDPLILVGFAVYLLLHGHTLAGLVGVAFFILFIVQAVIYIPRALAADRNERQP